MKPMFSESGSERSVLSLEMKVETGGVELRTADCPPEGAGQWKRKVHWQRTSYRKFRSAG